MQPIKTELQEQLRMMDPLIQKLREKDTPDIPGSLQIKTCNGKQRFYQTVFQEGTPKTKYLSATANSELIRQLAQQSYDRRFLHAAVEQRDAIRAFLNVYREDALTALYADLRDERRELVKPHIRDMRRYVEEWSAVTYPPARFDSDKPVYYTNRNEKVRSKSEKIIADRYHHLVLPYRYEYPLALTIDGKQIVLLPDFTVLNPRTGCEIYHEHLGMLDDPAYLRSALRKIRTYQKGGIFPGEKLILTYETSDSPFDCRDLDILINKYLL